MKYPTKEYTAEFTLPDSDSVYTVTREVIEKTVLRKEIEGLGGEVISIK